MKQEKTLLTINCLKKYYYLKRGIFSDKKHYIRAIDDVTLEIPRFHTLGLVGESGCGKSTLGKTILNLTAPSGGSVHFEGKELYNVEEKRMIAPKEMQQLRKEMAMIFQDPYSSLNPNLTIGDAVEEGVEYHNIVAKEERQEYTMDILCRCGLDRNAYYRYPSEYSGGQRQRAVIARALALQPKFVVCDEPTAALDVSIQSQILNLMMDMKEEYHLTYLFISHNLGVTRAFCDEIAVMYLGKIVEIGPAEEVYSHSMHPYTKALIASLPISEPGEKKKPPKMLDVIPSMMDVPKGCRFHTRCPYSTDTCRMIEPTLKEFDGRHFVACHLYDEGKKYEFD